jgi:hypothetical protein
MPPSLVYTSGTKCVVVSPKGPASGAKKWHPGYYAQMPHDSTQESQSYRFGIYDSIANDSNVKDVVWSPRWSDLEGGQGSYSAGFALVHSEINKPKSLAVPKRLIIRLNDVGYPATCPASSFFPSYLSSAGGLVQVGDTSTPVCIRKKWDATITGYFISMMVAYSAEFDSEPYFEGIIFERETAQQFSSGSPAGFTVSAWLTQRERLVLALSQAWITTNMIAGANYLFDQTTTVSYMQYLASIGIGNYDADTCPDCSIWADQIIQGALGGHDYRGHAPVWQGAEVSEMGANDVGPSGGYTPSQLASFANVAMHASHIGWDYNDWAGTPQQRWATGLQPYIDANPNPT